MSWKKSGGHEYLIKVINRRGGNKSLGPRSPETERIFAEFTAGKARAKDRVASLAKSVEEFGGMSAGIGINRVPAVVSAALRKLDDFVSEQANREPDKQKRDRLQAMATVELVREKFPHLKFDENAERMFPQALRIASKGPAFRL